VVLQAGNHFALRAWRRSDVGAAAAGGNTPEPDHSALSDSWKARRALGTHAAPALRDLDDIRKASKDIAVRATPAIEVGSLRSIVLRAD